jgi:hypothetical protein
MNNKKQIQLEDIATTVVLAKEQGVDVYREREELYFIDPKQFIMKGESDE